MSTVTIGQAIELALRHHQSGNLPEAEKIYRQVLQQQPENVDAMHYLGLIAHQTGQIQPALELLGRSAQLAPNVPSVWVNYGEALRVAGRPADAMAAYQRALELNPGEVQAHNNVGMLLIQQGKLQEALAYFSKAIELNNSFAPAYANLATIMESLGRFEEALQYGLRTVQLDPRNGMAFNNIGVVLDRLGRAPESGPYFQKAAELLPNVAAILNNYAVALGRAGRKQESIQVWQRAAQLPDATAEVFLNLGIALRDIGQLQPAMECMQRMLMLRPNSTDGLNNLGLTLARLGKTEESIAVYRRAMEIDPNCWEACNNLGAALEKQGLIDEAIKAWERTVEINPKCGEAWSNLGGAWKEKGQFDTAIQYYRKSLQANPQLAPANSNMLLVYHYHHGDDAQTVFEEHLKYADAHAKPLLPTIRPHTNDRSPTRKLRIGYVSADFRAHSVADFFQSIAVNHDRSQFEIFCYADVTYPDVVTQKLHSLVDHWRDILPLEDEHCAELIRQDQIDILVDLGGHSGKNRQLVFARKPAPVQFSYLGYPNTTGLVTIDYRLTDAYADPPGQTEMFHSEELVRLPDCFICYHPYAQVPELDEPPALKNGYVTFGSFNNFAKVSPKVMDMWASILNAVPGSKMMIKAAGVREDSTQAYIRDHFARHGIGADRLELRGREPDFFRHISLYHRMDIALDTFPYHGTTTTCEALWMGVPVVTRAGRTHVSRVGVSILTNIGATEWIGNTPEEYVDIATKLAGDLPKLKEIRSGLRARMKASPLTDAPKFARNVETIFREKWARWCELANASA